MSPVIIGNATLYLGDCREILPDIAITAESTVLMDPPYSSGGFQEAGKSSGSIGTRTDEVIALDNLSTRGDTGVALLRPLRRKLFDVGGGELLTIKQIMQRTGLGEAAVRSRISRGVKGAALLRKERRDMAAPRSSTMVLACRLADAYPDRLPTTKEIRQLYPMVEQTAERWLTALREARAKA